MNKQKFKPTILIDLDGVLNEYSQYQEGTIPKMKKGAKGFLSKLNKDYKLVLFATRNTLLSTKWLIENKIDKYFSNVTNIKTPAILQIDDRAICFRGDFNDTFTKIKEFKTYWKK